MECLLVYRASSVYTETKNVLILTSSAFVSVHVSDTMHSLRYFLKICLRGCLASARIAFAHLTETWRVEARCMEWLLCIGKLKAHLMQLCR